MSELCSMTHARRRWFAAKIRSRQEKVAFAALESLSITTFLPLSEELRRWTDRIQKVQVPLFNGYLFVHIDALGFERLKVLKAPGVVGLVSNFNGPVSIPERQIEAVRRLLGSKAECTTLPAIQEGAMVRVTAGPLTGLEGRLVRCKSRLRLAISIDLMQTSLLVDVSRNDICPVAVFAA